MQIMIAKAVVSVALCGVIGTAIYKTKNPHCLWALFFIVLLW